MALLFSLNVERSKHLDRLIPFLQRMQPDVACLQEFAERDVERVKRESGLPFCHYVQMAVHPADDQAFGLGILTRTPFLEAGVLAYAGVSSGTERFDRSSPERRMETCRYAVASVRLSIGGISHRVATTHFPWAPNGEARPFQFAAARKLIAGLQRHDIVLTGDFNAPRGGPIFHLVAQVWKDWIPADVATSIDPLLHRAGPLTLMVDGLFSTPHYRADDVRLHTGLSDHQAITARVVRSA